MDDRRLLELAAKAAGIVMMDTLPGCPYWANVHEGRMGPWNPLEDDGDRYRLISALRLSVDFSDCAVWKRLPNGDLIQEFWGGECGDEPHAVLRAAAAIGEKMP